MTGEVMARTLWAAFYLNIGLPSEKKPSYNVKREPMEIHPFLVQS